MRTKMEGRGRKEKGFEKKEQYSLHTPLSEEIMVGSLCLFAD